MSSLLEVLFHYQRIKVVCSGQWIYNHFASDPILLANRDKHFSISIGYPERIGKFTRDRVMVRPQVLQFEYSK